MPKFPEEYEQKAQVESTDTLLIADSGDGDITKAALVWDIVSTAAPVQSVNWKTWTVVLNTDDVSETITNKYFPEAPNDGKQYWRRTTRWKRTEKQ